MLFVNSHPHDKVLTLYYCNIVLSAVLLVKFYFPVVKTAYTQLNQPKQVTNNLNTNTITQ